MKGLRSLAAVVAGFGFMMFAGFVAGGLSTIAGKLIVGTFGAFTAGWMTARLAAYSPMGHAVVLALIAGAASLSLIAGGAAGGWYPIAAATVGVAGVLAGGWIRAAAGRARGTVEGHS
jgi:hypothetical protein